MLTLEDRPVRDLPWRRSQPGTDNPVIRKLSCLAPLTVDAEASLAKLMALTHVVVARSDLIGEDEAPQGTFLVIEGFACRFKTGSDGRRQITAYLLPGDLCHSGTVSADRPDNALAALSDCTVGFIAKRDFRDLIERHPGVAEALRLDKLVGEAILRRWVANRDLPSAVERMAHLLCELLLRLRVVGLVADDAYDLPLTEADLADTIGLSVARANRALHALERDGLAAFSGKRLRIRDVRRLKRLAGFRPDYLDCPSDDANRHGRS